MLLEVVREYVASSRLSGVRGKALDRVRELMVVLRRAGFSSTDLELLSGGKWTEGNIRSYSKDWGGEDESLVKEKEGILSLLGDFASSGRSVVDVSAVLALDRSVKGRESSLEEVAELWGYLREDMQPGEVGKMLEFYREGRDEGLTPAVMKVWKKMDDELSKLGFNNVTRRALLDASVQSGSVYNAVRNLLKYNELADKLEVADKAVALAEAATRRRVEEETLYNQFKESRDQFTTLLLLGWKLSALAWAPDVLKRADTQEKQSALIRHLREYEFFEGDKEVKLVKSSGVYNDPSKFAEALQEVRLACNKSGPLGADWLVNLAVLIMAKFPGLTPGDLVTLLLKAPDLSAREREIAEYLKSMDEKAGKMMNTENISDVEMDVRMLTVLRDALKKSVEEQRRMFATKDQLEAYEKAVTMATSSIPRGADLRSYWRIMRNMMGGLVEASSRDETLSEKEKEMAIGLVNYIALFQEAQPGEGTQ